MTHVIQYSEKVSLSRFEAAVSLAPRRLRSDARSPGLRLLSLARSGEDF